jgi:hypothetical protein
MTVTPGTAPSEHVKIQKLDQNGTASGPVINAQFNPTTMQYTITNSAAQGSGRGRSRAVDESTGKLTMDLIYDTTHSGDDVRNETQKIALLMKPDGRRGTPIVEVTWGNFKFKGALDQYRETLDFFSPEGMPLRASLSFGFSTVTEQNRTPDKVFEFASGRAGAADTTSFQATGDAFTYEVPTFRGMSTTEAASAMGNPDAGNELAAQNGIEDPRNGGFEGGDTLLVSSEPILDGPLAFSAGGGAGAGFGAGAGAGFGASAGAGFGASAGAGFGASAGAGFGASAGAGFGASAGAGFGASASAGAGFGASAGAGFGASAGAGFGASAGAGASFGANAGASFGAGTSVGAFSSAGGAVSARVRSGSVASAGVSASAGAFAALGPPRAAARGRFDVGRVLNVVPAATPPIDHPTGFGPGGLALRTGTGVDVGQRVSLSDLIEFEE